MHSHSRYLPASSVRACVGASLRMRALEDRDSSLSKDSEHVQTYRRACGESTGGPERISVPQQSIPRLVY